MSALEQYLVPDYGARQLAHWYQNKFGIEVPAEEVIATQHPSSTTKASDVLMAKARALYEKREVEYPVDFAMDMTMSLMRPPRAGAAGR